MLGREPASLGGRGMLGREPPSLCERGRACWEESLLPYVRGGPCWEESLLPYVRTRIMLGREPTPLWERGRTCRKENLPTMVERYLLVYAPLPTMVVYVHPGIHTPHHPPGYTSPVPEPAHGYPRTAGRARLTALRRSVTELTVSKSLLTDLPSCQLPTSMLLPVIRNVREAPPCALR